MKSKMDAVRGVELISGLSKNPTAMLQPFFFSVQFFLPRFSYGAFIRELSRFVVIAA